MLSGDKRPPPPCQIDMEGGQIDKLKNCMELQPYTFCCLPHESRKTKISTGSQAKEFRESNQI